MPELTRRMGSLPFSTLRREKRFKKKETDTRRSYSTTVYGNERKEKNKIGMSQTHLFVLVSVSYLSFDLNSCDFTGQKLID